jgi:transposase
MKIVGDDGWGISDYMWEEMKLIIPKPIDNHPLGCHKPRMDDRKVMEGILFVLKTGCQWKALDKTTICKHSVAHDRFQEWTRAGVFEEFWKRGLLMYDNVRGLKLKWQSLDGAITKAPLGGEKTGANPTDRAKKGRRGALSPKQMEFLSELLLQGLTGTTANLPEKPWRVFRSKGKDQQKKTSSTFA